MTNIFSRARSMIAALVMTVAVVGCESAQPPPIDVRAIGLVQAEIKRQVGVYMLAAEDAPVYVKTGDTQTNIRGKKDLFWCGSGKVDYDISSVKAELTTSLNLNAGIDLSITAPTPIPVGGTFSFNRASQNTQTLTYNLWPFGMKLQPDEFQAEKWPSDQTEADYGRYKEQLNSAQIAQVLLGLRQAQISGATRVDYLTGQLRSPQPCFVNYDPGKPASDAGNSYAIALTITTTVKGGVSVGVAAAKIGASAGATTTTGHSLKVTFVQRGLARLQSLREQVDSLCKGADFPTQKCADAIEAYDRYRVTGELGGQLRKTGFVESQSPGDGGMGTMNTPRGGGGGGDDRIRGGRGVQIF